ncbi:anthranilate synthase component I family protein [Roseibium sp. Sym1]|uniref:anthranilate synthase component I family protein n=1 Tax=Roseibium sp. Sym1 TaxID=3016006 RepID=UPI0022B2DE43|nr:anthranilate synthase component I family protein [Roseibium sp. Sym1]
MIKVSIDTVQLDTATPDIFSAYILAAQKLTPDEVFLLESCAGPDVDCRESILGIGSLATIAVFRDRVEIDAPLPLRAAMEDHLNHHVGTRCFSGGTAPLAEGDDVWGWIRAVSSMFEVTGGAGDTFDFGFLTCLSYDAASLIEVLPRKIGGEEFPLVFLRLYQSFLTVSRTGGARVSVARSPLFPEPAVDVEAELLPKFPLSDRGEVAGESDAEVRFSVSREDYLKRAETALEHIRRGDIYQVQIGHEIQVSSPLAPITLYRRLRDLNPSPYMFLCRVFDRELIGASPENYIRLEDRHISMRPIAGTIGKGSLRDHGELVEELMSSPKERAEHTMLVDLCRNDISHVARANSLNVDNLMAVEEFSHLFHLVSTVTGEIDDGYDVIDLVRATFPAGTMTGAPKIRAMEIIEDLETSRRDAYAGAVGLMGPGNFANLALCIRMATYRDGIYSLRASAGIVADSSPENEWRETIVKMSAIYKALTDRELAA